MNRLRKRALGWALMLALLLNMLPLPTAAALAAEDWSALAETGEAVYQVREDAVVMLAAERAAGEVTEIRTAEELAVISGQFGDFALAANIELGADWSPINLSGTFDGQGYTITLSGQPVFATINRGATVRNLTLEGEISSNTHVGSLAKICNGIVQNCISYVDISYTGTSLDNIDEAYYVAGLVAYIKDNAGIVKNCVYVGNFDLGNAQPAYGTIANCFRDITGSIDNCIGIGSDRIGSNVIMNSLWVDEMSAMEIGSNTLIENKDNFDPSAYVDQLNGNLAEGDLEWQVVGGKLSLKQAGADEPEASESEIQALQAAVAAAESATADRLYTADSWANFASALGRAQAILSLSGTKQSEVTGATTALQAAQEGLTERSLAVADLSGREVVAITEAEELKHLEAGKLYRLEADLELTNTYFNLAAMDCVFDGNGHTITLNNSSTIWQELGADAVIQNLGIKGSVTSENNAGAIARSSQGLIINCWSLADVKTSQQNGILKHTGGFVGELQSGGAVINSYVAGSVSAVGSSGDGKVGAVAGTSEANSLVQSCYSLESLGLDFVGEGQAQLKSCATKTRQDFYSQEFIALLNANRGSGREWTLSAEGFPHLGEAQDYIPPEAIQVTFTYNDGRVVEFGTDEGLVVSLQDADPLTHKVGSFSWAGAETWFDTTVGNKDVLLVTENGEMTIYSPGSVDVVGQGAGGTARFAVTVIEGDEVAGFRLALNGQPVGDSLTLQGSQRVTLAPQIKRTADSEWQTIAASQVKFSHTGSLHRVNGSIYAEEPGSMTLTAEYMGHTVTVGITSEFVPVESIVPTAKGTYVVQQRNPNSPSKGDFLNLTLSHGAGTVIVLPDNASYRDKWILSSSDNEVAEYVSSMLVAVLPKKAGTVTLTAVVEADGQQPRVEGSSQVTIKYFNPVQSVSIGAGELTVKENQELALPLTFVGPESGNGWRVTEPAMDWSFAGDGAVNIVRNGELGIWEDTVNGKVCEANDRYKLIGVRAGQVVVTGVPQDQTLSAAPVVFTVNVEEGDELAPADNGALAAAGIASGQEYLMSKAPAAYAYGDEWEIFALRRSGQSVAPERLEGYLDSVEAAYKNNPGEAELKPTTIARVVLTLGILGENAADFRGLDFIDMLCNSQHIGAGGNEPMWALLALDSRGFAEPEGSAWSRDKLVSELILQYQNPEGGFGLNDNVTASVDMTAMAVQALAPYYDSRLDVKQAVDKALGYLQGKMTWDCGFDDNVEAASQVLLALTALERDPALPENGFAASLAVNLLTNISSFQHEDGGYKHFGSDRGSQKMSTVQALLAFEAYRRWSAGESYLYDLSDVNRLAMLEQRLAEVERLDAAKYTADSWQVVAAARDAARQLLAGAYTEADLQAADQALAAAIAGLQLLKPDTTNPSPGVSGKNITVSFRLIGDNKHEGEEGHDKYINWIKTFSVTVPEDSTVYDVFEEALRLKGLDFEESQHGYISSIKAPAVLGGYWLAEFDNGSNSGWKFLVNGKYPNVGLRYYWPKNGDVIIWRYVDDYTDSYDDTNKWQEAEDIDPNPSMSSGGATGVSGEKTAIIAPEASIDRTGAAVSSVTYKAVAEAIKKAKSDEAESVTIMPQNTGDAKSIVVSLTLDSVQELAKAGLGVSVDTKQGSMAAGGLALQAIAEQAGGTDVRISITGLDTKAEAVRSLVDNDKLLAKACAAEVTISCAGKEITSFGGNELVINLPVDEKSFVKDGKYKVIVVSGDGTIEQLEGKCIRVGGQLVVQVRVSHLSTFIVTNEAVGGNVAMSFADVSEGQWFYGPVRFVYEAGLMNGESEGLFNPNGRLDRAMLVTILYRLAGSPAAAEASGFSDVAAGSWYEAAVAWASANGIVNGYEDGSFKPGSNVSREEMAAMLARYARFKGQNVGGGSDLSGYADAGSVSDWAQESLAWANAAGLILGDDNNRLNPQGEATRAEAATIIMRFVEK